MSKNISFPHETPNSVNEWEALNILEAGYLEFLLHMIIKIRLEPLSTPVELSRAREYCVTVSYILKRFEFDFSDKLPFDTMLKQRLLLAKFIGLVFHYPDMKDVNYSDSLFASINVLSELLKMPTFSQNTDIFKSVVLNIAQLYWIGVLDTKEKEEELMKFIETSIESLVYGFIENVGIDRHWEELLKQQCRHLITLYQSKQIDSSFVNEKEGFMKEHLKKAYDSFSPLFIWNYALKNLNTSPLENNVPNRRISISDSISIASVEEENNIDIDNTQLCMPETQINVMTQIGDGTRKVMMKTPPSLLTAKVTQTQTQTNEELNDLISGFSDSQPFDLKLCSQVLSVPSQFKISQSSTATTATKPSQEIYFQTPSVAGRIISNGSLKSSPPKTTPQLPDQLAQLCSIFPTIPAQAFRQFILPNDDALAEIMDGDLVEIKENMERINKEKDSTSSSSSSNKKLRSVASKQQLRRTSIDSVSTIDWNSSLVSKKHEPQPPSSAKSTGRIPWSKDEEDNLIAGYKRFGNNWIKILQHYKFNNRTNVNLKDKVRNLQKKGILVISQD